jgi:hypothetical protein
MIETPQWMTNALDRISFRNDQSLEAIMSDLGDDLSGPFTAVVVSGKQETNNSTEGTAHGNPKSNNNQTPSYYFVRVRRKNIDEFEKPDPLLATNKKMARKLANMHPLGAVMAQGIVPQVGELWTCRYMGKKRKGILLISREGVSSGFLSLSTKDSVYQNKASSWSKNSPVLMSEHGAPPPGSDIPRQGNVQDDGTVDLSGNFGKQLAEFGKNCWRGCQPTMSQLSWLIKTKGIKRVIRMNGNTGRGSKAEDTGEKIPHATEKALCESLGAEFQYIYSQAGFVSGKGYVTSKNKILPLLDMGDAYLHCTHGADRTGYLVAAYKKEYEGVTDLEALWEYTISFNRKWAGFSGYICSCQNVKKSNGLPPNFGYARYVDGFYPMSEWCKGNGKNPKNRGDCYVCKNLGSLGS